MNKQIKKIGIVLGILLVVMSIAGVATIIYPDNSKDTTLKAYDGIYSKTVNNYTTIQKGGWKQVSSFTFNLPVDSFVYVESRGIIDRYGGYSGVHLGIDNTDACIIDSTYTMFQGTPNNVYTATTGFQTAKTYYLTKGQHTVYLFGLTDKDNTGFGYISFNAIINQRGYIEVN